MRLSGGHDDTPFTCSGKGSGEFRLRRPGPGRTTHLVVQPSDPDTSVSVLLSRSALGSAPAWIPATAVTAGTSTVVVAPSDVTRVRIETGRAQRWSAGVLKADDLPVLEADGASDVGGGLFRHSLGPVHTAVSCEQPLRLMFFQLCDCEADCEADCENERHRAPTQIAAFEPTTCGLIQLPEMSGIVAVHTVSGWSVVPRDQATTGDLSALVRAEVARLLPGLVAEQLAALGVKGTPAARASAAYQQRARPDDVPSWYRDALEAADDFENQLTTTAADDVAGAGAESRRYRWIATQAPGEGDPPPRRGRPEGSEQGRIRASCR